MNNKLLGENIANTECAKSHNVKRDNLTVNTSISYRGNIVPELNCYLLYTSYTKYINYSITLKNSSGKSNIISYIIEINPEYYMNGSRLVCNVGINNDRNKLTWTSDKINF